MTFEIVIIGVVISVLMIHQVAFGAIELPGDTPDYMVDLIESCAVVNTDERIVLTTGETCEKAVVPFFEDLGFKVNETDSDNGVIIMEGDIVTEEESDIDERLTSDRMDELNANFGKWCNDPTNELAKDMCLVK